MLTIGTRFFGQDPVKDLPRLDEFLRAAQKLGQVLVAVNTEEDKCNALDFIAQNHPHVDAFAVTPWQKFVAPLNAIVYRAALSGSDRFLTASVEFPPEARHVEILLKHVGADTLVAGAQLPGHEFTPGTVPCIGAASPWHTYAMYNLSHLAKIGFIMAGDAPFDQKQAGVEKVVTIALFQKLFPDTSKAKLISIPGFYEEWNTDGWDEGRLHWQMEKIQSKTPRAQAQLEWVGLPTPIVSHIVEVSNEHFNADDGLG